MGKNQMTTLLQRALSTAGLQTIAACIIIEALLILIVFQFSGSLLGALVLTLLVIGPVSVYLAPPLYRYLVRAGSPGL